jgi:predicted nucleic-acid-binding protein
MIGLDTNVLVRYFVQDDADQTSMARKVIEALTFDEPGWVGTNTLLELHWVLRYVYKLKRSAFIEILDRLFSKSQIRIENEVVVEEAFKIYRSGKADFADCMIACTGFNSGCTKFLTFDKLAARDAGMTLLG